MGLDRRADARLHRRRLLVAAAFVVSQLRAQHPLIDVRIFAARAFAFDNAVLVLISMRVRAVRLLRQPLRAGVAGRRRHQRRHAAARVLRRLRASPPSCGGKILDTRGCQAGRLLGCALCAAGFFLWGTQLPRPDFSAQWYALSLAGAGLGLVLGPVSTDAFNRARGSGYGEVTGITQTVRNLGASLGLAVMGSLFITENATRVTSTLTAHGVPRAGAQDRALDLGRKRERASRLDPGAVCDAVQLDFAHSTQTIAWVMAGIMLLAFVVAKSASPRPAQEASRAEAAATPA